MKISLSKRNRAMTLIELFAIVAVLTLLAAFLVPALVRAKRTARRISCVNNLMQIGLCFRIWDGDHTNRYPMALSQTNGGTMEYITGPNAFRHFQIMSNELSTPHVLFCPAECDRAREMANAWDTNRGYPPAFSGNSNTSYFVGVDATETNPQMILVGDRNITNGTPVKNGLLDVNTNHPSGWTDEQHRKIGNIAISDGSVQQLNTETLRLMIANTGLATNRLQMP
jgi:competence protein ComGC